MRPLHIISITSDLNPLRLALSHKNRFPYLRHGAADTLLHRGRWKSRFRPGLSWELNPEAPPPPHFIISAPLPGMKHTSPDLQVPVLEPDDHISG